MDGQGTTAAWRITSKLNGHDTCQHETREFAIGSPTPSILFPSSDWIASHRVHLQNTQTGTLCTDFMNLWIDCLRIFLACAHFVSVLFSFRFSLFQSNQSFFVLLISGYQWRHFMKSWGLHYTWRFQPIRNVAYCSCSSNTVSKVRFTGGKLKS